MTMVNSGSRGLTFPMEVRESLLDFLSLSLEKVKSFLTFLIIMRENYDNPNFKREFLERDVAQWLELGVLPMSLPAVRF